MSLILILLIVPPFSFIRHSLQNTPPNATSPTPQSSSGVAPNTSVDTDLKRETPDFSYLSPDKKNVENDLYRVSPATSDPVFAYTDTIQGVPVIVSQQRLPKAFEQDTDGKIGELAKSYGALQSYNVDGINVFVGTSAKGPESIIFTKQNLLVLIKTDASLPFSAIEDYIKSLKQ